MLLATLKVLDNLLNFFFYLRVSHCCKELIFFGFRHPFFVDEQDVELYKCKKNTEVDMGD